MVFDKFQATHDVVATLSLWQTHNSKVLMISGITIRVLMNPMRENHLGFATIVCAVTDNE
jgi:hypothetical protein